MDASNWGYWLAGDKNRFSRTHFIGITVESSVKPSFTTEKIDEVFHILLKVMENRDEEMLGMKEEQSSSHEIKSKPIKSA